MLAVIFFSFNFKSLHLFFSFLLDGPFQFLGLQLLLPTYAVNVQR